MKIKVNINCPDPVCKRKFQIRVLTMYSGKKMPVVCVGCRQDLLIKIPDIPRGESSEEITLEGFVTLFGEKVDNVVKTVSGAFNAAVDTFRKMKVPDIFGKSEPPDQNIH
jgi:hypothetical protein